jgi:hypothetical protein
LITNQASENVLAEQVQPIVREVQFDESARVVERPAHNLLNVIAIQNERLQLGKVLEDLRVDEVHVGLVERELRQVAEARVLVQLSHVEVVVHVLAEHERTNRILAQRHQVARRVQMVELELDVVESIGRGLELLERVRDLLHLSCPDLEQVQALEVLEEEARLGSDALDEQVVQRELGEGEYRGDGPFYDGRRVVVLEEIVLDLDRVVNIAGLYKKKKK